MTIQGKNKKKIILRITTLILALLWMRVIFGFSSQPASVSMTTSEDVSSAFVRIADFFSSSKLTDEQVKARALVIDHAVRKAAHGTEYAVLAVLWLLQLSLHDCFEKRKYWITQIICSMYAVTDEIHQFWSAGRTPQFKDVCIDSAGACIALLIAWGVTVCIISSSNRRRSAEKQ